MFILKIIGFVIIIAVLVFAVYLLKAVSEMEAEIKAERTLKDEE